MSPLLFFIAPFLNAFLFPGIFLSFLWSPLSSQSWQCCLPWKVRKASEAGWGPFPFFNDSIVSKHKLKKTHYRTDEPTGNPPAISRAKAVRDRLFGNCWGTTELPSSQLSQAARSSPADGCRARRASVGRGQHGGCPLLPHKCPLGWD